MTIELRETAPANPCCEIEAEHVHSEDSEGLQQAAATFKALSDPTRLRILKAISGTDELCECNIVPTFGLSQPTISYHLKILREAGLVRSERRGQWVYHRLNEKALFGVVRNLTEIAE
ncbi:MAG: helix-turn-helix transcriptional regulator [Chloroflexi bacterium]|nr:helix-turn-helix transcriptional regulator [Chloroflexota bacterium]